MGIVEGDYPNDRALHSARAELSGVDYMRNPYYANGAVFVPGMLDTLLCQGFYNQGLMSIVESLLDHKKVRTFSLASRPDLYPVCSPTHNFIFVDPTEVPNIRRGLHRAYQEERSYHAWHFATAG